MVLDVCGATRTHSWFDYVCSLLQLVVFGEFGNPRIMATGYSCDPCVFISLCEIGHFVRLIVGYIQYLDHFPI